MGPHQPTDWIEPIHAGLWRGIYPHKNTLGSMCSVALVILLFFGKTVSRSRIFRLSAIAAAAACLVGAKSGTGIVLAVIMGIVILVSKLDEGGQIYTFVLQRDRSIPIHTSCDSRCSNSLLYTPSPWEERRPHWKSPDLDIAHHLGTGAPLARLRLFYRFHAGDIATHLGIHES